MATFEDLLLTPSEQSDLTDNQTAEALIKALYHMPKFVDMIMLFKQAGELNIEAFRTILITLLTHVDCFVNEQIIVKVLLYELSDYGDLTEYHDDLVGVIKHTIAKYVI